MKTVAILFNLLIVAVMAYVVVTFVRQYLTAAGSTWQRLVAAAGNSATLLWGKFCVAVAGLVGSLDYIADAAGAPEAKDFINQWVGNPKVIAAIMLVISLVSMRARMRSL